MSSDADMRTDAIRVEALAIAVEEAGGQAPQKAQCSAALACVQPPALAAADAPVSLAKEAASVAALRKRRRVASEVAAPAASPVAEPSLRAAAASVDVSAQAAASVDAGKVVLEAEAHRGVEAELAAFAKATAADTGTRASRREAASARRDVDAELTALAHATAAATVALTARRGTATVLLQPNNSAGALLYAYACVHFSWPCYVLQHMPVIRAAASCAFRRWPCCWRLASSRAVHGG
jgi:hypothetical protein